MKNRSKGVILLIVLITLIVFSINFIDSSSDKHFQQNPKWFITENKTNELFLWFENSSNPNTYFCVLDKDATNPGQLSSKKLDLYYSNGSTFATLNDQKLEDTVSGLDRDYFGWCRNLESDSVKELRLGKDFEIRYENQSLDLVDGSQNVLSTITLATDDYTILNGKPHIKSSLGEQRDLHYFSVEGNFTIENLSAIDMNTQQVIDRNLQMYVFRNNYDKNFSEIRYDNCLDELLVTGCDITNVNVTRTFENWTLITNEDFNNDKIKVIKVTGDVNRGDYYDISYSVQGVDITPFFATISGDFSSGLQYHWDLNGSFVDSHSSNDLTNQGTTNTSGKLGDARSFDGNNDYMTASSTGFTGSVSRSFNFWVYSTDTSNYRDILTYGNEGSGDNTKLFHLRHNNDGNIFFQVQGDASKKIIGNKTINQDEWVMVTYTLDSSTNTSRLYVNASLVAEKVIPIVTGTDNGFNFGRYMTGFEYWQGRIDLISAWNDTVLSQSQIETIYNSDNAIPYSEIVASDPSPKFTEPTPSSDSITYGDDWTGVDFGLTNESDADTWFINDSNFTINSTGYLNDADILSGGSYSINVSVNDSVGQINSTIYSLTVNTKSLTGSVTGTSPINYGTNGDVAYSESNTGDSDVTYNLYREGILVSSPDTTVLGAGTYNYVLNSTGGTNYSTNTSIDTFSLTVNKNGSIVNLFLDGARADETIEVNSIVEILGQLIQGQYGTINLTIDGNQVNTSSSEDVIYNYTETGIGVHIINLSITETENYTASSESWQVTFEDTSNPSVTMLYPVSLTVYGSLTLDLNYSASDNNEDSCWYSTDEGATNSSAVSFGTNFTDVTGTDGENTWTVYCNDTSGNIGLDSHTFDIDVTAPLLTSPNNVSLEYGVVWQGVDFDASDTNNIGTWFINDTSDFVINQSGYLNWSNTRIPLDVYHVNVSANDTLGNINSTIFILNYSQNTSACDVVFNTSSPINYPEQFLTYQNCISGVSFTLNGTSITNNTAQNVGFGSWNVTVARTDTTNYSNVYDAQLFTINKGNVFNYLNFSNGSVSSSNSNLTIINGSNITVNASINISSQVTDALFNLTSNGVEIGTFNATSLTINYSNNSMEEGLFPYNLTYGGNENYSFANILYYINVSSETVVQEEDEGGGGGGGGSGDSGEPEPESGTIVIQGKTYSNTNLDVLELIDTEICTNLDNVVRFLTIDVDGNFTIIDDAEIKVDGITQNIPLNFDIDNDEYYVELLSPLNGSVNVTITATQGNIIKSSSKIYNIKTCNTFLETIDTRSERVKRFLGANMEFLVLGIFLISSMLFFAVVYQRKKK